MPKRKTSSFSIGSAYTFIHEGRIPGPTTEEWAQIEAEWTLRLHAAYYMGWTDEKIIAKAKKDYRQSAKEQAGRGMTGDETWDKDCPDWRKAHFIDHILPEINVVRSKHYPNFDRIELTFKRNDR